MAVIFIAVASKAGWILPPLMAGILLGPDYNNTINWTSLANNVSHTFIGAFETTFNAGISLGQAMPHSWMRQFLAYTIMYGGIGAMVLAVLAVIEDFLRHLTSNAWQTWQARRKKKMEGAK
jgi:hypothetical protein